MRSTPSGSQETPKAKFSPAAAWKRMTLALFRILRTVCDEMVLEYVTKKKERFEVLTPAAPSSSSTTGRRRFEMNKVRMGIGKQLSRSKAQKNWNHSMEDCTHEAKYLRHRAGRGRYWWTCLQCGCRWERIETASSSLSNHPVEAWQDGEIDLPKTVPAPRSRQDVQDREVQVQGYGKPSKAAMPKMSLRQAATNLVKKEDESAAGGDMDRGRGVSRPLRGTLPTRRSKTPTRTSFVAEPEILTIHSDTETWDDAAMISPEERPDSRQ